MSVYCCDALVRVRLEELRTDDLLDGEDDAVLTPNAERRAAILDGLDSVFDLEVAAIRGEDGVG